MGKGGMGRGVFRQQGARQGLVLGWRAPQPVLLAEACVPQWLQPVPAVPLP